MDKDSIIYLCWETLKNDGFPKGFSFAGGEAALIAWERKITDFAEKHVGWSLDLDGLRKQFRIDVLSKESTFEYCVVHWEPMDVLKSTHVDARTHYIKGGGQHCEKCCRERDLCGSPDLAT